ncbi:hypothetical protein P8452_23015 [Trifolium repens]|nr:hypothetical protein P8452_23015 [Trifolium repens]
MDMQPPRFLLSWLLELVNTKSLTVTASTLQVLFLNANLLKIKLPSLALSPFKGGLTHKTFSGSFWISCNEMKESRTNSLLLYGHFVSSCALWYLIKKYFSTVYRLRSLSGVQFHSKSTKSSIHTSQSFSEVLIQMSNSADETMMVQPTAKRPKHGETENADRLSDLPDCSQLVLFRFSP